VPQSISKLSGSLFLVGATVFVLTSIAFMRVPLLPDVGSDLGLSAAQLGLVTTIFALGRLATDVPAGRLADRMSPERALALAALVVGVACALFAAASSLPAVAAALGLVGVGSALANTIGVTAFSSRAAAARRGMAVAAFTTALMLGQMFGPALGGLLGEIGSWRTAPAVGVSLALAIGVACLVRAQRAPSPPVQHPQPPPPHAARRRAPSAERIALSSVNFSVFFALGGLLQTLIPLLGARDLALSVAVIGLAAGLGGVSRLVGGLITGRVSDRAGRRAARLPSLFGMAAGAALLVPPLSGLSWLGALLLLSVTSSGVSVAATVIADRTAPGSVGRALGVFRLTGDLGLLAGPVSVAFLYQHGGRVPAVLLVCAVLLASALACTVLVHDPQRAPVG
jgi:predicted MFS family arabinose efflux permease